MKEYHIPGIIEDANCIRASVVVPIIKAHNEDYILFEKRSSNITRQAGDISFPGGVIEDGETEEEAGLRETCEELLIEKGNIEVIAPLSILVRHSLIVFPFLARISNYQGTYNEEVKEIITIPLSYLQSFAPKEYNSEWIVNTSNDFPYDKISNGKNYQWPRQFENHIFYEYNGYTIWGYTAKILNYALKRIHS